MLIKTLQKLTVPNETNTIFVYPEYSSWTPLMHRNRLATRKLPNLLEYRRELINIATDYTDKIAVSSCAESMYENIIVTGHQPIWHHCGIFVKNVITDRFARQTGGIAVQLVLDHDICNTSMFLSEYDNNGFPRFKTIPLELKQQDIPLESRPVPSKKQLRKFIDSVSKISKGSLCSEIWCQNLHCIIGNTRTCRSAADIITQLQAQLNRAFGLEIIYLPLSLMSQTSSFTDFVCSVICNAVGFVRVYNKAIKNKKQTDNLKPNQTIRPLKTDYLNNIIELPFWLVSQTRKRNSLYVSLNDRNVRIGTAENVAGTIDSSGNKKQQLLEILRKNKCVIRPKAVTLTLFARLYLADLFVHGIGAGNYEYITNHLIRDYYRISKLDFGLVTATMTLPADANNRNPKISKKVLNYREFFFGLFPKDKLEKLADIKEVQNEKSLNHCPSSR